MNSSLRAQSREAAPQLKGAQWRPECPPWSATADGYRNIATGKNLLEKTRFSQLAAQKED
jgi:hypothetical protein